MSDLRANLIAALKQVLMSKTAGHTDAEAEEVATAMVDQAFGSQEDSGHAGD